MIKAKKTTSGSAVQDPERVATDNQHSDLGSAGRKIVSPMAISDVCYTQNMEIDSAARYFGIRHPLSNAA